MKLRWLLASALASLIVPAEPLAAQKADKKPAAEKGAKDDAPGKVKVVIAEGVGKTAEDAIKDALRNAVREVVGALVEGETRVKNDEVIEEKILTASGGFVAGYEPVSQKEQGGLVRVKIKAKVERAVLVERLRDLKITVQGVDVTRVLIDDKDRRFSDEKVKSMSREEMVANKTEVIHDALADLYKVLAARARTPDRFDYSAEDGTLKVDVKVSADPQLYAQFVKRLQARLEKLSVKKPAVATTSGKPGDLTNIYFEDAAGVVPGFWAEDAMGLSGPDLTGTRDVWCLGLVTELQRGGASLKWNNYLLDADVRKCLAGLHGELKVQVTLRDVDGKAVAEEALDLSKGGWLGSYYHRYAKEAASEADGYSVLTPPPDPVRVSQERSVTVLLAPAAFNAGFMGRIVGVGTIGWAPERTYPLKVKLSPEELKRVKDIVCAVQFAPPKKDN